MPPEIIFGEEKILSAFKNNPPDYIVLADKDTSEYGYPAFGRDYGVCIFNWLKEEYGELSLIGKMPLMGRGFGILITKRK